MKEEEGLVIAVDEKRRTATVKIGKHDECVECGACGGSRHVVVEALNSLGAEAGQRVRLRSSEQNMLLGAFVTFIMPLLLAGLGGLLVSLAGGSAASGAYMPMAGGALLGFLLGVVLVKRYDRHVSGQASLQPEITEIVS